MKHRNQKAIILSMLKRGKRISQIDAIQRGIFRLSARILEIRREYGDGAVSTTLTRSGFAIYKWEGAK